MTLTLNDACNELTILSEYQNENNQSVTLTVTVNCTTTYDDIDVPVDSGDYGLVPSVLNGDATEFTKGIYTIKLVTVQEDGTSITEVQCFLIDCELNCTMLDTFVAITEEENLVKALSYHALLAIADCTTCNCSDWCTLYNTVTDSTCTTDAQPCGCN